MYNCGDILYHGGDPTTILKGPLKLSIKRVTRHDLESWQDPFSNGSSPIKECHRGRYIYEENVKGDVYYIEKNTEKFGVVRHHLGLTQWTTSNPKVAMHHKLMLEAIVSQFKMVESSVGHYNVHVFRSKMDQDPNLAKLYLLEFGFNESDCDEVMRLERVFNPKKIHH